MCILSYIYGSNSLELGEDIELFYVVQDFCLVTVSELYLDLQQITNILDPNKKHTQNTGKYTSHQY